MSPSGEPSTSDAGPTALPNTYSITPLSPVSFDSDAIPDPLLHEMELAQEELAANEQTIDVSRRMTVSYEEALQREMEYQKRVKAIMSQHQVENVSLPTAFQEFSPKASPVGIKRKLVSIELEPSSGGMHHSTLPPEQLQDGQDAPHILKYRESSPKQFQDQQFSVQQSLYQHSKVKPGQQQLHNRQPLPHLLLDDQPSYFQELPTRLAEHLQCQQPLQIQQTPRVQHLKQLDPVPNKRPLPPQRQSQDWRRPLHRQPQGQPLPSQKQQAQDTPPLHHQSQGQSLLPQQKQQWDFAPPMLRQPQGQPLLPQQQRPQDRPAPQLRQPLGQPLPPQQQQSQDRTAPLLRRPQGQIPPPQQQLAPPLLRQPQEQPPLTQQQQSQDFVPPLPRRPQGVPNYQENPVWCNLCKIKCVTHFNLKIHCQGKKHRVKHFEVFGRKMGRSSF